MKTLIEHARIITMDDNDTAYEDGYVLIEDDQIIEVGAGDYEAARNRRVQEEGQEAAREIASDVRVDARGKILMPGMVNTHCHVPMMPFRTMGDDCPDRLRRFLFPLELEAMTKELIYEASRYGIAEMLLSGVTTFLDMYYFEDEVARACEELGMRGFLGETVINMPTCDSETPYGGLAYGEWFLKKWKNHPLVTPIVAPHATNTNDQEALVQAYQMAKDHDTLFTLHNSEMDYEMQYFEEHYHQTPTQFLADLGVLGKNTLLAHCIHMSEEDLNLVAEAGAKISHCVGSNTKAGKGVAPVKEMLAHGISVGLGTDGAASGNNLSIFTQMRLFASFHKTKHHDRSLFPAREIVRLGTIGGAKALGIGELTGSIEAGKKADLVLVETDSVNMFPCYNPYSALVYSANASNVDSVWVNGRQVVERKQLICGDLVELRESLQAEMGEFVKKSKEFSSMI